MPIVRSSDDVESKLEYALCTSTSIDLARASLVPLFRPSEYHEQHKHEIEAIHKVSSSYLRAYIVLTYYVHKASRSGYVQPRPLTMPMSPHLNTDVRGGTTIAICFVI